MVAMPFPSHMGVRRPPMQPRSLGGMVVIGSVGSATPFWEEGSGEYSDNHLIIFFIDIHYDSSHLIYLHIHQLSLLFEPPAPNQGAPEPSTPSTFALPINPNIRNPIFICHPVRALAGVFAEYYAIKRTKLACYARWWTSTITGIGRRNSVVVVLLATMI